MPAAYARLTAAWKDFPSTATLIDSGDLENFEAGFVGTNNDITVGLYNGTSYVDALGRDLIGDTSKIRKLIGWVDPVTIPGWVDADFDEWVKTPARPVTGGLMTSPTLLTTPTLQTSAGGVAL